MSWHCLKCHNHLWDTYHSKDIPVENMFGTLASIPGDDTVFNRSRVLASPSAPLRHSKPYYACRSQFSRTKSSRSDSAPRKRNNLRLCILNRDSIGNRKAELEHMAEFMKPDIIFFTEKKIDSDINSCEFLPEAHAGTIRKDRKKDGGGVLIPTRKDLDVVEINLYENSAECGLAGPRSWGVVRNPYWQVVFIALTEGIPLSKLKNWKRRSRIYKTTITQMVNTQSCWEDISTCPTSTGRPSPSALNATTGRCTTNSSTSSTKMRCSSSNTNLHVAVQFWTYSSLTNHHWLKTS